MREVYVRDVQYPPFFILCVEILATQVRNHENIKGITFNEQEYKINQYADDTFLILRDLKSVTESLNTVKSFSQLAGSVLNLDKTEGLLLGNLKQTNLNHYDNITFCESLVKCLGVYLGHDKQKCEELNWTTKLSTRKNS